MLATEQRPRRVAVGPRHEPQRDGRRDRGLAVGAEDQAGERDADLAGRDVGVELAGVGDERRQPQRQEVAVLGHLAHAAAPHADRRELRRDVERRQDGEHDDDHERGHHVVELVSAGTRSRCRARCARRATASARPRAARPMARRRTSAMPARWPCAGVATMAGSGRGARPRRGARAARRRRRRARTGRAATPPSTGGRPSTARRARGGSRPGRPRSTTRSSRRRAATAAGR